MIQQASVIGKIFWLETVTFLRHKTGAPSVNLKPIWKSLIQKELIKPVKDNTLNIKAFTFCNPLFNTMAYDSLLVSERREIHAHVAQWLIEQKHDSGKVSAMIADHLEQAQNNSQAIKYFRFAGEQAQHSLGFQETIYFFKRALVLLAKTDNYDERIQLTREIARAMINFGQWDNAKNWLQDSLELAKQSKAPRQIMGCLQELTQLAKQRGEYQDAMSCIEEGLEVIKRHKELIGSDPGEYIQNTTDNLSEILNSATDRATEMARTHADEAKKKLGKAFSGAMVQWNKSRTQKNDSNDGSQES